MTKVNGAHKNVMPKAMVAAAAAAKATKVASKPKAHKISIKPKAKPAKSKK